MMMVLFPILAHAWQANIMVEEGFGKLHGYVQTPRGGDYNTTSEQRPSYKDVGVSFDTFFHSEIALSHSHVFAFIDYFYLSTESGKALSDDLLTHSRFIPAGYSFDMKVRYHWYQFGLGFDSESWFEKWRIAPRVAANWLNYLYEFSSPVAQSERGFNLMSATVGLKIERFLNPCLSIDAFGEISIPVSELELFDASIGVNYTVTVNRHINLYPRLSVGILSMDYEDLQKVPNHFLYQSAPYLAFSLNFAFF